MTYEQLMYDFGRLVGIEDMEVDPAGAVFAFDDFRVVVRPDRGSDRIVLSSALADIPSERRGDVSEKLLQLNFVLAHHGGLTVAADGHDGKYHCLSSLVLAVLDARRFEAKVSGFIAKAKVAAELLELEGQAAQAAALQERLEPRSPDAQVILA